MNKPNHSSNKAANAHCIIALLLALHSIASAQDNAPAAPAPAAAPVQTEMQKWIATTDAQWQAAFNRDVTDVHGAELKKLALQYAALIEAGITKASGASDLEGAVALRNEQKRFADTNVFPEQDEAADAAAVKQIRATIRAQLAQLEKENATRTKALHGKYDQSLAQAQAQLTQRKRLDDALLVKAKRDEVAAAWITPAIAASVKSVPSAVTPSKNALPTVTSPKAAADNVAAKPDGLIAELQQALKANVLTNGNFANGENGWEVKNATHALLREQREKVLEGNVLLLERTDPGYYRIKRPAAVTLAAGTTFKVYLVHKEPIGPSDKVEYQPIKSGAGHVGMQWNVTKHTTIGEWTATEGEMSITKTDSYTFQIGIYSTPKFTMNGVILVKAAKKP